jgi:osmotically-inducible protein OsmY
MKTPEAIKAEIMAILEREACPGSDRSAIDIIVEGHCVTLEGEVGDIIAKRRIPHLIAHLDGVHDILNHLRVRPSEQRGDGAILDAVYDTVSRESVFKNYTLIVEGQKRTAAPARESRGEIVIAVHDSVVTLTGTVESLSHKRLADVLCWWVIGVTDVHNRLHVVPPEQGTDDEISDALRIVLEMDPWLNAGQIMVHTHDKKVFLDGLVHSPEQRHMAECNAWLILGVHEVINRIIVRP